MRKRHYLLGFVIFFFLFTGIYASIDFWVERSRTKREVAQIAEEMSFFLESSDDEIMDVTTFKSTNVCLDEQRLTTQFFVREVGRDLTVSQIQELWVEVEQNGSLVHQRVSLKDIGITVEEDSDKTLPYNLNDWNIESITDWIDQGYNKFFWVKKFSLPYGRKLREESKSFTIYKDCR